MVSSDDAAQGAEHPVTILTARGVWRGIKRLLPISVFVIPFGSAFGVAAVDAGMTPIQAFAMSALAFSGAAQFASLDFLVQPVAFWSLGLVVMALNARHVIMGAAISPWVNPLSPAKRVLALAWLSDPNFADSQPTFKAGERDVGVLLGGGLVLWGAWILGTVIGVAGGTLLGQLESYGTDVLMACFFAAVVAGQLGKDRRLALSVVVASFLAIVTLNWLPVGWNVILGAIAGGLLAVWRGVE